MPMLSHDQLRSAVVIERLRTARNWCATVGVLAFALALIAVSNTVVNPETWSSAFHALAASGAFLEYASWFAVAGCFFVVAALLISLYVRRIER
jgi:hypothetical protein